MGNLKLLYLVIAVILIIISGTTGYMLGKQNAPLPTNVLTQNSSKTQETSFFETVSASVKGKVTKIDNGNATITNSQNQSQTFKLADKVMVTTPSNKGVQATPSSDISKIELNKDGFVSLQLVGNSYQIVSVAQFPTAVATPPSQR